MKNRIRIIALCLCLLLTLAGCYREETPETSGTLDAVPLESLWPEESGEPTPTPTPLESLYYDYSGYRTVLQDTEYEYEETMGGDYLEYALSDLDGDGILELLVKEGTCEADFLWQVYTVGEMGAQQIGSFGGSHSTLFTDSEPGVVCQYGQMGHEKIIRVTYDGQYLSTKTLIEQDLAPGEDYSNPGARLTTQLITDPSLIP